MKVRNWKKKMKKLFIGTTVRVIAANINTSIDVLF